LTGLAHIYGAYRVVTSITDGTHHKPVYTSSGYKFLSAKNVTKKIIDWTAIKYVDEKQHKELSKRVKPQRNDILLAKNGTTGVAAINDTDEEFDIYVSLALLRPSKLIDPYYLLYVINSELVKSQFNDRLKGVGVPNLHLKEIKEVTIPLPDMKTQKSIVSIMKSKWNYLEQTEFVRIEYQKKMDTIINRIWCE
jgi:type I restriction enzyme S subunit